MAHEAQRVDSTVRVLLYGRGAERKARRIARELLGNSPAEKVGPLVRRVEGFYLFQVVPARGEGPRR